MNLAMWFSIINHFLVSHCFLLLIIDDAHVQCHAESDALIHSLFKNLYYNSVAKNNIINNVNYCYKGLSYRNWNVSWSAS